MINELIHEMVDAGVHYGHQTRKWNPKMKPFLMKDKGGIYIIDLEETVRRLDKASDFLTELAGKGKKILFVGCKRQAQDAVREAAEASEQYFVNHRWLGGTLTNLTTIRRSVERLKYLEDIAKQPEYKAMSKKELSALARERDKLFRNLCGIRGMEKLPDAIVIVDSARETIAVAEARRLNIPVVAIVDTNADPAVVDYPIPGNDDAIRSIRILLQNLVDSIVVGSGSGKDSESTIDSDSAATSESDSASDKTSDADKASDKAPDSEKTPETDKASDADKAPDTEKADASASESKA